MAALQAAAHAFGSRLFGFRERQERDSILGIRGLPFECVGKRADVLKWP